MADNTEQAAGSSSSSPSSFALPRVSIQFCTQCKWMLRAAYFAQELLSTFSTSLGEVALQPSTGGVFIVQITTYPDPAASSSSAAADQPLARTQTKVLWDRKAEGGFPETKELKRRVRDVIQPGRDLGHVDRDHAKKKEREGEKVSEQQVGGGGGGEGERGKGEEEEEGEKKKCDDCQ